MTSVEGSTQQVSGVPRGEHGQNFTARSEQGQFAPVGGSSKDPVSETARDQISREMANIKETYAQRGDMQNMLKHIEQLEAVLSQKDKALNDAQSKAEKFSARTREGMQSALDTLMKKWMDAVETKDDKCKEEFKKGMDTLVKNSAEENGVWQMMVAASSLHERQAHDLDSLRLENNELELKIDGQFASSSSRTEDLLGKRKAEEQGDRVDVAADAVNIWDDFAKDMGQF